MNAKSKVPRSVSWWEPRWSFVPRIRRELRTLISPRLWLRVLALVTIIVVPLAAFVQAHVPGLQFNWSLALLKSIGLFGLYISAISIMLMLLPPRITVNHRGISVQHGNSARCCTLAKTEGVNLTLHSDEKCRLWITCANRSRCYGLPTSVDVASLRAILGEKLTVHDYRDEDDELGEIHFRVAS